MAEKWIVGVDGGGTKTDFVLCGADGSVAARTLTGGSNVNESGLPAVGALLEEGVSRLLELSGVPRSGITALFAGLSGILSDGGKQAEKLREFLEERLPGARCRVEDIPVMDISSTDIRARLAAGKPRIFARQSAGRAANAEKMGGCCARRRVPERCEASPADNRAESAALSV